MTHKFTVFAALCFACTLPAFSALTPRELAEEKMGQVNSLIAQAQSVGIDTLKEEMTAMTADLFLDYADWDETNKIKNISFFNERHGFSDDPEKWADALPDLERNECFLILQEAEETLVRLLRGEIQRKPIPDVDWTRVDFDGGDHLTFNGRPVFLNDFVWSNETSPRFKRFHGNMGGIFTAQSKVDEATMDVNPRHIREIKNLNDRLGYVFIGNKPIPDWMESKYGPGFRMREDTYTAYDIDHPGAREINTELFRDIVPLLAGKKGSSLGYMMCNEPHFYTTKVKDSDDPEEWGWARGPVSEYTKDKFRNWLAQKHQDISELNALWGTSFAGFDAVEIDIPIYEGEQGSAKWYDWFVFNQKRVADWYTWLGNEIKTFDPNARVHLKVIPNHWAGDLRGHGIDLEVLTALSDIMGNDHGATYVPRSWKPEPAWTSTYGFDWRALCMGYDFMKSVSPAKMGLNSEAHYLSQYGCDFDMSKDYVRAVYWLSRMLGEDCSTTWFWIRDAQGAPSRLSGEYAGSINQRPVLLNELTSTIMDLNCYAEEILEMQRLRKPIRIFHSETMAVSRKGYMSDLFELYESMFFEGVPLGFVTKNILNEQDDSQWDVVLVKKTERVTSEEMNALQGYLNRGGTLLVDAASLSTDEYGRAIASLNPSAGTLILTTSLDDMASRAFAMVDAPPVVIDEVNRIGTKGCFWKWIQNDAGNRILSIVNIGKSEAELTLSLRDSTGEADAVDLLTGRAVGMNPVLEPYEVLFVEISSGKSSELDAHMADSGAAAVICRGGLDSPSDGPVPAAASYPTGLDADL